eukprot:Trichotokara_eunicae@DN4977_c0_g1_i1.p1
MSLATSVFNTMLKWCWLVGSCAACPRLPSAFCSSSSFFSFKWTLRKNGHSRVHMIPSPQSAASVKSSMQWPETKHNKKTAIQGNLQWSRENQVVHTDVC